MSLEEDKPKMATEFKKEFLEMIPEFRGEPAIMERFISVSETILKKFLNKNEPEDFFNTYLLHSVLSKIKGPAADIVGSHPVSTWDESKTALLDNFGDRRDVWTLTQEMCCMRQGQNEDGFKYFERVNKQISLAVSYLQVRKELDPTQVIPFVKKLGLRSFLKGLNEPLGSLMRTKNPLSMGAAASILINDFQFIPSYRANAHGSKPKQNQYGQNQLQNNFAKMKIDPQKANQKIIQANTSNNGQPSPKPPYQGGNSQTKPYFKPTSNDYRKSNQPNNQQNFKSQNKPYQVNLIEGEDEEEPASEEYPQDPEEEEEEEDSFLVIGKEFASST